MNTPKPTLGSVIKERRLKLGLTQAELARRVGCAEITVRKLEADALRPSVQMSELLALALGIPENEQLAFVQLARQERPLTPIPTPSPMREEIGQEDLSGRAIRGYELGRRINAGGFGVVYEAVQTTVERDVAVKIILPKYADHPDFIRRFEFEAQLVAQLEHPHIVPLYDYWREPGVAYLIMQLMRGGSLEDMLKEGALPPETLMPMLIQVGAALHTAHQAGIIHRDIKPANVLLDDYNNAYLADFGIAKNLGLDDHTQEGAVIGSPAYISPEQIKAEPIKAEADIYGLGIMVYELLTGSKPFQGPTPIAYIQQHLNEPIPPLAEGLPLQTEVVLLKATAKNPADRYADIPAFLDALQKSLFGETAVSHTTTPLSTAELAKLENPYKGLRAFTEADAHNFFGRETLIQSLLTRMADNSDLARFLAIVGPSGSGKSSVAKAGLLPALRRGGIPDSDKWFTVEMTPGSHPFEELEAALLRVAINPPESLLAQLQQDERGLLRASKRILPADPDIELLLLIDQFEELFTLTEDEVTRLAFLDSLVTAVLDPHSRLRIAITMRADFIDKPLQYVDFGDLMRQRTEFVLPLTADELEQVIVKPVAQQGMTLEAGLAAQIIHDAGNEPGMLPLLQYALTELFDRHENGRLTKSAYEEHGGVLGALGHRGDDIYQQLTADERESARQLFLRLITLGEGVEDTRRRVRRSELLSMQTTVSLNGIIDRFGAHRLLTFDRDPITREPTVEIAHEALLREWRQLGDWVRDSRDDMRMERVLETAVNEWKEADEDESYLLRGSRLVQFEGWMGETAVVLTAHEHTFLNTSIASREDELVAEEERRQRELETAQQLAETERLRADEQTQSAGRLRKWAMALTAVLIIAVLFAIAAATFAQQSQQNANVAATRQIEALSNAELAASREAEAVIESNQRATAEAVAVDESIRADEQRDNAVAAEATAGVETIFRATAEAVAIEERTVALEQQGIAEEEARDALEAYSQSLAVHAQKALADLDNGTALALALSASNIDDPPQEVIDTLKRAAFAPGPRWQDFLTDANGEVVEIWSVDISPDGRTALAGLDSGNIVLLDIETGETLRTFTGHTEAVVEVVYNSDGITALSSGCDTEIILWEVATGEELQRFSGHSGCVFALNLSPDGRKIISGAYDSYDVWLPGELFLWDLESGELIRRFTGGHLYGLRSAAFSPDGRTLISSENARGGLGGEYGAPLILWDAESGEIIHRFPAPNEIANDVAISPNGKTALAASGRRVYLWDLQTGEELHIFEEHGSIVYDVAFSPDGNRAISSDLRGELILWDVVSREPLSRFTQRETAFAAFHPDGRTALSGSPNGDLVLWDLFNANEVRRFEGHEGGINGVRFTPDGKQILSAGGSDYRFNVSGNDNSLRLWDVETGEKLHTFEGHTEMILAVEISRDGRRSISTGDDGTIRLWDIENGTEINHVEYHTLIWDVSLHPDGKRALTAANNESFMLLWDMETGEVLQQFIGHHAGVVTVAFSPDGKTALSGGFDGVMILWDVESGEQLRRFLGGGGWVGNVAYSHDGRLAILGYIGDGNTIVWDVETGETLNIFTGNQQQNVDINQLAAAPDGQTVATSTTEGMTLVWDMETGEILHRFTSREPLPVHPALSPDGRFLLAGSQDHTIILWSLETFNLDELREWITSNRVVRELTCEEREQFRIEPLCPEADELPAASMSSLSMAEVPHPTHNAQIGENRGEIILGGYEIWLYEGLAGETLTIQLNADNPASPQTPQAERIEFGQLDTVLLVIGPNGHLLAINDESEEDVSNEDTNSLIKNLLLPKDGIYRIEVHSWIGATEGAYSLVIESILP